MKLLLLCLGLTLVCAQPQEGQDVVTCKLDLTKISGEWHTILLASDKRELIEENGSMRLFIKYVETFENSSLLLSCHINILGVCIELSLMTDATEERCVYSVPYDGYNTFRIVEGVYNDYLIIYALNIKNEERTELMGLVARKPDVRPELKKRFEELGIKRGIPQENILDVSNANPCSELRGSPGA
ncbi:major allergen Equ c 1 [Desmodus rotundus]|uniref:major allergen Equ c 1 n=1 Tax=Desmodus rotundus TaxID=9430 RepID=UPI002381011E|nr:major allergen Equ c 1 [Desmodus rotundus]